MSSPKSTTLPLASVITAIVLATSIVLTGTLLALLKQESSKAALEAARTQFQEIAAKNVARILQVFQPISTLTDTAAMLYKDRTAHVTQADLSANTPVLKHMLDSSPYLFSVYVGYEDGVFHQLIAAGGNPQVRETYKAPAGTEYVERFIVADAPGVRRQVWNFLTRDLTLLGSRADGPAAYDPRSRTWYTDGMARRKPVFTEPYVFSSSRLPGLTCARALAAGNGVFGVDISLAQFSDMLEDQHVAQHGSLWVVDATGHLVAYPGLEWRKHASDALTLPLAAQADSEVVRRATAAVRARPASASGELLVVEAASGKYIATVKDMPEDFGQHLSVVVAAPLSDITGPIDSLAVRILTGAIVVLVLMLPLAMLLGKWAARPVGLLTAEADRIRQFDFSPAPAISSHVREVNRLASVLELMKTTIQERTASLEQTQDRLEKLVRGGLALSAEKDMAKLVSQLFETAREISGADGGVVYLKQGTQLEVEMLSLHSSNLVLGGLSEHPAPRVMVRPEILPFLSQDSVLRQACETFTSGTIAMIRDVKLALFPTGLPEEPRDMVIHSLLSVPIVSRRDEVLGVIQLFNPAPVELADEATPENGSRLRFVGSLAAQAAVTLDNRNLIISLKEVFDALIQVIASSIDAKSPYTSGHCARVPVLAEMLARATHETGEGPLAGFRIEGEEAWRQLWVASWLHDCGKVTTPEYVVDKATKLETIYNRFHEVRMRFEVLRRDAEIAFLRQSAASGADEAQRAYAAALAGLEADFNFLAGCNVGGEFMTAEAMDRVRNIATRTWVRHYSDRAGISPEELRLKADAPEELPATEQLLSDKPEHLIPRHKNYQNMVDAHGNPIQVPEYDYNRGEIYNLCISRGTLTLEEIFKIREHIFIGLEMLGKLPFPNELARMPEIAVSHHETLIGTGYPLKKTKEQLPVEGRILAIADIFEALTASDRPYKKAKPLSEALRIMSFMCKDQHIDGDIFDIFLRQGVFLKYAEKYLDPAQLDVSDCSPYLSTPS